MGARQRIRRLTPYLLLAPGILWLLVFYVYPSIQMFISSFWSGSLEQGYTVSLSNWTTYTDAIERYQEQFLRSLVYGARGDRDLLPDRLPARVHDRVPRRPLQEPPAVPRRRAVLHELPAAHPELEGHPRRRRDPVRTAQGPGLPAARVPRAGDAGGGDRGHRLQLPAVHDPADLRLAREDRHPARGSRQGPVRRARGAGAARSSVRSSAVWSGCSSASRSATRSSSSRRSARSWVPSCARS